MTYIPASGSVVAFQSDPNKLVATVSIIGTVNAAVTNTPSISGTINVFVASSVLTVGAGVANQSVSGTVGASIIGTVPVTQSGAWTQSVVGNVSVFGTVSVVGTLSINPASVSGSVGIVGNPSISGTVNIAGNPSISGTVNIGIIPGSVVSFQGGTQVTSLVSTVPSSVIVGTSIFGQLPAGTAPIGSVATLQGTNPWIMVGSVYGSGSVVSFQGGAWSTSLVGTISGSVVAFQGGTRITSVSGTVVVQSIVGTYAEDAPSTTADPGLFVLGVRNDTVSSLVSADKDYGAFMNDSQGRAVIKPFSPDESTFSYVGSVVSGSVTLIKASAIGKRSYVTDIVISNTGSVFTLITLQDGSTSVIGYAPAPATGGAVMPGLSVPIKTAVSQDLAFKIGTATSILYMTVNGYQAP